jgi:fructose-bisphosphate aldolase class I
MLSKLEIQEIAETLVEDGKGILAADESLGTISRRFEPVGILCTEENRRAYRDLFLSSPGIEAYISGVILFDETIRQSSDEGLSFPDLLKMKGILPGIKVDKGRRPLPGYPGEKLSEGLDGLRERLVEYRTLGARFTKWRSVFSISPSTPTRYGISVNARTMAIFARMSQEEGLTPILEPEVLMDGPHHLSVCEEVTCLVLRELFHELAEARILLEGMLLKPNMVMAGKEFPRQASVEDVADGTVRTLRRCVPTAVPGIVLLSGGQTAEQATAHLNAINALGSLPWKISFSFGRALQEPSLQTWQGRPEKILHAQELFVKRSKLNSLAVQGAYQPDLE